MPTTSAEEPGVRHDQTEGTNSSRRLSDVCICSVLIIAPLAVGTVNPGSWALLLVLSLAGWILALRGGSYGEIPHPLVTALVLLSGLAVLIPLLPLPPTLLEYISPHAAEQWARGLPGSEEAVRWGPWHRAPGPGSYALLRWCAAVSFLFACATRAAEARWRERVLLWVLVSGGIAIAACLLQTALELEDVLGIYEPRVGMARPLRATFLNENHWAGFLGMMLTLAVGELLRGHHGVGKAALLTLLAGTSGVMLLITPSHSGVLGAAAGLVAVTLLRLKISDVWRGRPVLRGVTFLVAVAPIPAAVSMFLREEATKLSPVSGIGLPILSDEERFVWMADTWDLVKAHPWTGVGVGGFLDAFPGFRASPGRRLAYQPEMLPFKLLSEDGLLLGGLLLLLIFAIVLVALWKASDHPELIGAAAALCSLLVHEQADFATHTGGVLMPALVLLLLCLPPTGALLRRRYHLATATLLAALALLVAPSMHHWNLQDDLDRAGVGDQSTAGDLEAVAGELWAYHPSSFVLAQELGRRFAEVGDTSKAMSWLNRAMVLAPGHPDPHLMTARLLRGLGARSQALIEYRLALEGDWDHAATPLFKEVLRAYSGLEPLQRIVPPGQPDALGLFAQLAIWEKDPRAVALAELAYERRPEDPRAISVRASTLVSSGRHEQARDLILTALSTITMGPAIRYLLLRMLWNAGEHQIALEQLSTMLSGEHGLRPGTHLTLAQWRHEMNQPELARISLRQARRGTPETISKSLLIEAAIESRAGDVDLALGLVRRAQSIAPNLSTPWVVEARLLAESRQTQQALETARKNSERIAASPEGRALLKRLEINWEDGPADPLEQPDSGAAQP